MCSYISKVYILVLSFVLMACSQPERLYKDDRYITYSADMKSEKIALYWKNEQTGEILYNLAKLNKYAEAKGEKLLFAMNGGMFHADYFPVGLYVEDGKTIVDVNIKDKTGNFYMKPNGIFYINEAGNEAGVMTTEEYTSKNMKCRYATQSGPMLLVDGEIHRAFNPDSKNKNIRNGVGILPDGNPVFVISRIPVCFYEFAVLFKVLGCKDALYLDGYVSKIYYSGQPYLPNNEKFGVMIGITES